MTRAQSKAQLDCLKSHLQSTTKNDICTDKRNYEDTDYDKLDKQLQAAFNQFDGTIFADNCENEEFTTTNTKPLPRCHLESI